MRSSWLCRAARAGKMRNTLEAVGTGESMPIKNYTTKVNENRTVGEIQILLAEKGARSIQINYDDHQRPDSLSFMIIVEGMPIPFKLPCNFDGVFNAIGKGYKDRYARQAWERKPESREHSRWVAWRIVKDWVAAQMALIEAEQATIAQVFLPYAVVNDAGERATMYDKFLDQVSSQKRLSGAVTT